MGVSVQVVLIGDAGVGKTCVVQRFKHSVYVERHGNTIGVDFMLKTVELGDKKIKVGQPAGVHGLGCSHTHTQNSIFCYGYF